MLYRQRSSGLLWISLWISFVYGAFCYFRFEMHQEGSF